MTELQQHNNLLNNKYKNLYITIIENRIQNPIEDGYTENHHILPRSLGGSDNINNLVRLTAREHFIIHYLLTKMFSNEGNRQKMLYAFNCMGRISNTHFERYMNARLYEKKRIELNLLRKEEVTINNGKTVKKIHKSQLDKWLSKGWILGITEEYKDKLYRGENNKFYGKNHTEETLKLISESRIGTIRVNNGKTDKCIDPEELDTWLEKGWKKGSWYNKENGRKMSEEQKEKIRKKLSGENNYNFGKFISEEQKKQHSEFRKARTQITRNKENKMILKTELDSYIAEGWKEGCYREPFGKLWITNGEKNKFIDPEDLEKWSNEGYYKGRVTKWKSGAKGKITITNGTENKLIEPTDEIPEGWKRGQTKSVKNWNHTEETKARISASKKGKTKNPEQLEKMKQVREGLIPFNKDGITKFFHKDETKQKLNEGWIKGFANGSNIPKSKRLF